METSESKPSHNKIENAIINATGPSVIQKNDTSTRIKDTHDTIILPRQPAFKARAPSCKCSHELPGPSRRACLDDFQDLQHRPAVFSNRPFGMTSYLYDPRDEMMNSRHEPTVLFRSFQGDRNLRSSSTDDVIRPIPCCQENGAQRDEDSHVTISLAGNADSEKERYCRTFPSSYPDRENSILAIQKPLPGQWWDSRPYCGPLESYTSETCDESRASPSSDIQESYGLPSYETQNNRDIQEKEEQKQQDQQKICNLEAESHIEECFTQFDQESRWGSPVDRCEREAKIASTIEGDEARAYLCQRESNIREDQMPTTRNQGLARCPCHENAPGSAVDSEMQKKAEHLCKYWTHSHQEGTTCLVCFKTLKRSYYMKSHMLIHTGEKPYGCAYCSKTFNQIGNRNAHQRMHTGEKPYACDYCDKRFIFNSSKHNHMKMHRRSRLPRR